jgi:DNA-binding transcriptional MerR regulator
MEKEKGYPIRVVSKKTGLSVHVIRAWEKRYGAVIPRRTTSGQRLYTEDDVERLCSLAAAVRGGWSIGGAARLPAAELEKAAAEAVFPPVPSAPAAFPAPTAHAAAPEDADRAARVLAACMEAVKSLDGNALREELFRGSVELGETALIDDVVVPLATRIGEAWREGTLRILHEHAASAVLATYLGDLLSSANASPLAPCAVAAALPGERHALGALAAAVTASLMGWRVRFLGADTPAEEIARAAELTGSRAVLVSLSFEFDERGTREEISRIHRFLPEGCDLILGGDAAARNRASLSMPGVTVLGDLQSLRRTLAAFPRGGPGRFPGLASKGALPYGR